MIENNSIVLVLVALGIPFLSFIAMFITLVGMNRKTTGEIKHILPPDVFLKIIAIIMVVDATFILTFVKIMDISVAAAILGSVVTGVITSIKKLD